MMNARPDFPIVDTHVHLWDPALVCYDWMDAVPTLRSRHDLSDLDRQLDGIEIESMVFLECDAAADSRGREQRFVRAIAATDPRLAAMVFHTALEEGDAIRPQLEAFAADAQIPGVRRLLQGEKDPRYALQPRFLSGVRALADYDLHFELCLHHSQMDAALELARTCPRVRFVLDHLGKPAIKEQQLDPWRDQLREMGRLDNVWCKLSGLCTEADHGRWTAEDLRPYVEHCLDCFAADRVFFGGDWPVARLATSYPRWVECLWALCASLDSRSRRMLFRDNAIAFYRIESRGSGVSGSQSGGPNSQPSKSQGPEPGALGAPL